MRATGDKAAPNAPDASDASDGASGAAGTAGTAGTAGKGGSGSSAGAGRLDEVLDATYTCLTRYGVRRTTMDDIASAMGVSRSAVYLYVRGKDDAFRRLAERLHTRSLERARESAEADLPPAERVRGILAAKLELVLELAGDSPHTAELLDAKARLFGDICHDFTARLRALLADAFAEAFAESPPEEGAAHAEPGEAADICIALVIGLESVPDGARLLGPAAEALLTGLLPAATGAGRPDPTAQT